MKTQTDHSFTLLVAVVVAGVIAALASPTRANSAAPAPAAAVVSASAQ